MIGDEQTHKLPADAAGIDQVAACWATRDGVPFRGLAGRRLRAVETHYAALFEHEAGLGDEGNLVFTATTPDPDTVETLSRMGFERPADIWRVVSQWHMGRYRALQSERARAADRNHALLLKTFGESGHADEGVIGFDRFLSGLPAGIQVFSMLQSNPRLIHLLALILSAAPRLAAIITESRSSSTACSIRPSFPGFPARRSSATRLEVSGRGARIRGDARPAAHLCIRTTLPDWRAAADRQSRGDGRRSRLFGSGRTDQSNMRWLRRARNWRTKHGVIDGASVCLSGLGRLGSREMTAGSDLDLILLYDVPGRCGKRWSRNRSPHRYISCA
jgi:glutamate-ammonia-ligase adenylyltransferase